MREILLEQKELLKERIRASRKIVQRERKNGFLETSMIKVITGIRRCGKSFLTYLLLKDKNFGYVNFDDERIVLNEPDKIKNTLIEIYGDVKYLFLDEVQNLDKWELFVNRLYREGYNLFITGSNAKLLSRELATHLTGRHYSIELFPFSFREFLKAKDFKENLETGRGKSLAKHELFNYMTSGGFPEIVVEEENPKIYLNSLFTQITEKDIILRYNIRYRKTIKEIASILINNISSLISSNRIKNIVGLKSDHTARNYIGFFEEAYLFLFLSKFSFKLSEIERSPKKVYCIDPGIANSVSMKFSENLGRLMENVVALDILRRKSYWHPEREVFYWKDYQGREVDFVLKEGLKVKQLIQTTYASGRDEIERREIKSLLKASRELGCKNLLVITWDYEDEENLEGRRIRFLPLWKWLLKDKNFIQRNTKIL